MGPVKLESLRPHFMRSPGGPTQKKNKPGPVAWALTVRKLVAWALVHHTGHIGNIVTSVTDQRSAECVAKVNCTTYTRQLIPGHKLRALRLPTAVSYDQGSVLVADKMV